MKAIFEFDAPESCVKCPIGKGNPVGDGTYCPGCKQAFYESYSKQNQRAPFCPLKIVPDDTTAEPEPLTLEQLREMDGEPVYIVVTDKTVFADKDDAINGWAMVRKSWARLWDKNRADIVHIDHDFSDYGETWLAYPRKPREG